MRLAQVSEAFGAPEDHSWLAVSNGTDACFGGTMDDASFLTIFTDGKVPSGVVVAKNAADYVIPYALPTTEVQKLTPASSGATTVSFQGAPAAATTFIADSGGATTLRGLLESLPDIDPGDVVVTVGSGGDSGKLIVTFGGQWAGEDVPLIAVTGTGTAITTGTAGGAESPAGEGTPVGILFTTKSVVTGGHTGCAIYWGPGAVTVANLPVNNGLDAHARAVLHHIQFRD